MFSRAWHRPAVLSFPALGTGRRFYVFPRLAQAGGFLFSRASAVLCFPALGTGPRFYVFPSLVVLERFPDLRFLVFLRLTPVLCFPRFAPAIGVTESLSSNEHEFLAPINGCKCATFSDFC